MGAQDRNYYCDAASGINYPAREKFSQKTEKLFRSADNSGRSGKLVT